MPRLGADHRPSKVRGLLAARLRRPLTGYHVYSGALSIGRYERGRGGGRVNVDNLASGVIGALIGAVVSVAWLMWDRRQHLIAVGRVTSMEIARAQVSIQAVLDRRPSDIPLTRSAFDSFLVDLAALLTTDELRAVYTPYVFFEGAEAIRRRFFETGDLQPDDVDNLKALDSRLTAARTVIATRLAHATPMTRLFRRNRPDTIDAAPATAPRAP